MANYNVTGNKIKFTDPMLVEGNLPDEPQDDALDPVAQYREEQMRQLGGQGAAPSGKPDLANPHPESMAALKAANGGKIPDHLQRKKTNGYVAENFDYNKSYPMEENGPMASGQKYDLHLQERNRPGEQDYNFRGPLSKDMRTDKGFNDHSGAASGDMGPFVGAGADKYDAYLRQKNPAPKKPVFRYDAGSIGNGQGLQNAVAASRPERPDAGTASTAYDGGDSNDDSDSDVMPWAGNPQMRIPSNIGADSDEMTEEGDPSKRIASNMFRGPPRSAMMPGVTPVDPDTKTSDLAVNPGFTPYYESETGKGVKEQGRQRLQEYLQKLAGRGKQHEERLAHDNDAAGAKARNDFGALLMDSASMMGTLGGKRADTTQLAKFPGKLYQMDMAPSRSAMMYENAEDKDFKTLADIGERGDRTETAREKLYADLMARRDDEKGRNDRNAATNASHERIAESRPGAANTQSPFVGLRRNGKPVAAFRDRHGKVTEAQIPEGTEYSPPSGKPPQRPTESENKYAVFGKSAVAELPLIEELEKTYQPGWSYELDQIMPSAIGRHITSDKDKRYASSMARFLDNLVHAATGANATEAEVRAKLNGYAVRPGDPPELIAEKHKARRSYVQGIIEAAGSAAKNVVLPKEAGAQPTKPAPLEGMTREEKEAELERLQNG